MQRTSSTTLFRNAGEGQQHYKLQQEVKTSGETGIRILGLISRNLILVAVLAGVAHPEQADIGSFHELRSEQRQLVVQMVGRFNLSTGQALVPEHAYDAAPISVRSTFEAVSQALLTTKLTSTTGEPLGNALELIEVIEDVAGEVSGARGDQQFRVYAVMKPGAIEKLQDSVEFFRDKDNRYYHKGFPVCFRMPGLPSIQVSLTRDGKRADIDVDYRSPKFPNALVNGHLRAANSDVRAGNNGVRHNRRWNGLSQWWKLLFGFNFGGAAKDTAEYSTFALPPSPRTNAKQPFEIAVHDFLTAWLVEDQPRFAVPYFSRSSYPCLEALSEWKGKPLSPGAVRHEIFDALANYRKQVGAVKNLEEVVSPATLTDPTLRPFKNKYENVFTAVSLPSNAAEQDGCSEGALPAPAIASKEKYGQYFGSVFRLHHGELNEGTLYFLWARQYKHWQILSLRYIDGDDRTSSWFAEAPAPEETRQLPNVPGDREANLAIRDFLESWLVKGDFKTAMAFVSSASYACFDKPLTGAEGEKTFLSGLIKIRKVVGPRAKLSDYLEPFVPDDPTLRLVIHPDENAFSILSTPEYAARSSMCHARQTAHTPSERVPTEQDYGRYYTTAFLMKVSGGEPAALYTLWGREKNRWKMVGWQLIAP